MPGKVPEMIGACRSGRSALTYLLDPRRPTVVSTVFTPADGRRCRGWHAAADERLNCRPWWSSSALGELCRWHRGTSWRDAATTSAVKRHSLARKAYRLSH